jgi:hypothetical protein
MTTSSGVVAGLSQWIDLPISQSFLGRISSGLSDFLSGDHASR